MILSAAARTLLRSSNVLPTTARRVAGRALASHYSSGMTWLASLVRRKETAFKLIDSLCFTLCLTLIFISHSSSVQPTQTHPIHGIRCLSTVQEAARVAKEGRDAYKVSRTVVGTDACLKTGLDKIGITNPSTLYRNLSYPELWEHENANKEGTVVKAEYGDTFMVMTGKYTGRSPKDKWVVLNPGSETAENIDWNDINRSTTPEVFDELYERAIQHFNTLDKAYVSDLYCGVSEASRKKVRFITEMSWQQHFVTNMFIRPETPEELDNFDADFTVINCCSLIDEDWKRHGLNSETAVVFNIEKRIAVVFGTYYGGENKKGIFSLMNYWLPMQGKLPMHCSANVGKDGDVALFFGLSGTGKTTLSADPERALIGDDEHGW